MRTTLGRFPIPELVGQFQRTVAGSISVEVGQSPVEVTGRMEALQRGAFGEVLRTRLVPESAVEAAK